LAPQQTYRGGKTDAVVTKIARQTLVSVTPANLGFSLHTVGTTSAAKKVTLTNNNTGSLRIRKIYIGGRDHGDFREMNDCGATLAAGVSCTISVTFGPTAKYSRIAALAISDSDPASPQAIALTGTATVVSLSKAKLSFANQPVGTTSTPQSVTLKNVGSTPLNFTTIAITGTNAGDFSQTNTCGTSIAAGASCTITVTFGPAVIGIRNAAVSVSDDGGHSPQTITLSGNGT
jgi:HYDIN/CFA65/VesB-like, Ig-like domain